MIKRMTLRVNLDVNDNIYYPGIRLIEEPRYGLNDLTTDQKLYVLLKFCKFLAKNMKRILKLRIKDGYNYLRWEPLTPGYLKFKEKAGLSLNIWEATGFLVNSIIYYKKGDSYYVGVDPNKKYPKSNTRVLFVAECMEFGTRHMPARPLFGPTIRFMKKHIRRYWEKFLEESLDDLLV